MGQGVEQEEEDTEALGSRPVFKTYKNSNVQDGGNGFNGIGKEKEYAASLELKQERELWKNLYSK